MQIEVIDKPLKANFVYAKYINLNVMKEIIKNALSI